MKFQLIGSAAILALSFSKVEAQTLGQSAAAGNEVDDTPTTLGDSDVTGMELPDTGFKNTENESTVDNSSTTSTPNSTPTGPNKADHSSPATEAPAVSTDDGDKKVSTTDDSAPDDIDTKSDDGSTDDDKSPTPSKTSDASRIVFTGGVTLVAVTVAAMF